MTRTQFSLIVCLALILTGCAQPPAETAVPLMEAPPPADPAADTPTQAAPAPEATPTAAVEPGLPPLPADPQRIEFQAEDGVNLVGYYYPASVNPAPLVVLMHWAGGDQTDWLYVGMVAWLQNRGAEIPQPAGTKYFDTPYPFPPLPEGRSYAVFTFDFRGYGESGSSSTEDHILDARAAYATAAALDGVDPARIAGIGASIGADAVADGCDTSCAAALSLGPGDYLGVKYADAVAVMDQEGKPAWCVATEDTPIDLAACNSASGDNYVQQIYPNGGHAMRLFRADLALDPPLDAVILDFLELAFGG